MVKTVNIEELQKDAVEIFTSGFACSESVIFAIRKHFEIELSDDAIAMSSGFPWGKPELIAIASSDNSISK